MAHVDRFAQALIHHGCAKGDVVGINLPNIPQYLIAQIGVLKAGCAALGLSPLLTPREMAQQLSDCRARALVTLDPIFDRRFVGISDQLPDLAVVISTGILDFLSLVKRTLARVLKKRPTARSGPCHASRW